MELTELRSKIDMEKLYVDFGLLRNALSVSTVVEDLNVSLSEASREGERRAAECPKCGKARSFALNINTNRFNCFAKGCTLKGGGVIDFFAKLYDVSAKEASHLLAYAYGIQPYAQEDDLSPLPPVPTTSAIEALPTAQVESKREVLSIQSEKVEETLPTVSEDTRQTAEYLISSIKHNLAQLEQILISQ